MHYTKQVIKLANKFASELESSPSEINPKNLLTNFDETFQAMKLIEGDKWAKFQEHNQHHPQTIYGAKAALESKLEDPYYSSEEEQNKPSGIVIYGEGGFTRYPVLYSGEVCFSEYHAKHHQNKLEEAERSGFRIWK
ncbi:MAG: hypothetical protein EB127_05525 [Alphaproteobacteria bacterium]|nr:hypothetical protein [Alphaproteobacteria bacterium]